jgi:hypothetical protein
MAVPVFVGDRVLVTTLTTGTGNYDLGAAVAGYLSPFLAGVVSGSRVAYVVVDSQTNPATFEIGEGTYTSAATPTVSRTLIIRNTTGGTSAEPWSAGTKYLFLAPSASRFVMYDSDGGFSLNTHLTLVSGAASSVAVSTPGDRNTGLFFPGPDRVALATNGSTRLEFNATGAALFNNIHGTSGQVLRTNGSTAAPTWVSLTAASVGAVDKAGDTMTGALSVAGAANVYGNAGTERTYQWATGATARFQAVLTTAAESGSNAGSNFALRAFSDAGVSLGDVFEITRATRKLDFKVVPSVNGSDLTGNLGTITQVSAGTGLTGGGASGTVTLSVVTTHGAIGTYSYAQYNIGGPGTISLDATTAGSNLQPSKSGTWKLMGTANTLTSLSDTDYGLWLRVS